MMKVKEILLSAAVSVACLLCLFLSLEILLRLHNQLVRGIPFSKELYYPYDKKLGWTGKKIYGDAATSKLKVFIVGDSFTHGCGVKETDMYYRVIGKGLDAEIFVYAGGGYGTLQEYMILDETLDQIKPDLVLLQVCSNDFINNLWELESASYYNNNLTVRPYLINEKIEYRFPLPLGKRSVFWLTRSRAAYFLLWRFQKVCAYLAGKGFVRSVEMDIAVRQLSMDDFSKSVSVTKELVARTKKRLGKIPIVVFTADRAQPYLDQFRLIFKKSGIEFIETVPERINQEPFYGLSAKLPDRAHWNEKGNKICGDVLTRELIRLGYGPKGK